MSTNLLEKLEFPNAAFDLSWSWPVNNAWLCCLVQFIGLLWICARMNITVLLYLISNTYSTASGPDWPRAVRADPDRHQRHPHPPHAAPLLDSLRQGRWTQRGKWYRERLFDYLKCRIEETQSECKEIEFRACITEIMLHCVRTREDMIT